MMWTPKRLALLVTGFVLFLVAYAVYGRVLGSMDGLPPLPEAYLPIERAGGQGPTVHPLPPTPEIEKKLQQAFGSACEELEWSVKLEVRSRGLVLAARDFRIDGNHVYLKPLSVAIFSKNNPGPFPEINTIRGDSAFLTFDGPISNPWDMGKRKLLAAEIEEHVAIANNRHTPQRSDDITLYVPSGKVHYEESQNRIWTKREILLEDMQSTPKPTTVRATGMDVFLTSEPPHPQAGKPAPKKPHSDGISGVSRVVFREDVRMELFVDARSGFLANDKTEAKSKPDKPADHGDTHDSLTLSGPDVPRAAPVGKHPGAAEAPPEKAEVHIQTHGPFNYDVIKDFARFDIAPRAAGRDPTFPEQVTVTRFHENHTKSDQLICEHLELQFRRKAPAPPAQMPPKQPAPPPPGRAPSEEHGADREIETVHATGGEVVLSSDAENFDAHGNDFFYRALTRESTLKGDVQEGMWAMKDGNIIHARELHMLDQKDNPQVRAMGPGTIKTLDENKGTRQQAAWKDTLVSRKDDGLDLFILTGDAYFEDPQTNPPQRLQADTLKVWVEPSDQKDKPAPAAGASATEPQGRRLRHVDALGHVVCKSRELNVHDTEHLEVYFKDLPPGSGADLSAEPLHRGRTQGAAAEPTRPAPPGTVVPTAPPGDATVRQPPRLGAPGAAINEPAASGVGTEEAPPRPIDLQARLVKATAMRIGPRSELAKLWAEGKVFVHQDPASVDDKGVDIEGDTLDLTRKELGNLLIVTGDLAKLRLNKIQIIGPEVRIDQGTNNAWVDGRGGMQMESNANFRGEKIAKSVPLKVYWSKAMHFNGQFAEFYGGVQAEQEQSKLLCQSLQVCLDRPVSFKEGEKGGQPPKVKNLVCNHQVQIEDTTYEDDRILKYQRIECPELSVNNEEETVNAAGWGIVRILQPGSEAPDFAPPPSQNQKKPGPGAGETKVPPKDDPLKLTRVKYKDRMWADNKQHIINFSGSVEVYNLQSDNPDEVINPNQLPPGCLYMRCNGLQVLGAKNSQEMQATGRVFVEAREFYGRAEKVTYLEKDEKVIFEGAPGGMAQLFRFKGKGLPYEELQGHKIIYFRKTGDFKIDDGKMIQGN